MKLIFVPDPARYPDRVTFPVHFVVTGNYPNLPEIPTVVVCDNTCYEDQLALDMDFRVNEPIHGDLQVICRADRKDVVNKAIKAALIAHNLIFQDVEVEAKYELAPLVYND